MIMNGKTNDGGFACMKELICGEKQYYDVTDWEDCGYRVATTSRPSAYIGKFTNYYYRYYIGYIFWG